MTISYPLSLPAVKTAARINFDAVSVVGMGRSPFSGSQQVYAHQGMWYEAQVELPPMERADAEQWVAFLLSLNGQEGTFYMGDPAYKTPRGSWLAPKASGAQASGTRTIRIGNVDGLTWKAGDWLQIGSGSSSHLHKVVQDGAQSGSPSTGDVEIWPATRAALANLDPIVVVNPVGTWRLASNKRSWSIGEARIYGLSFGCVEAL